MFALAINGMSATSAPFIFMSGDGWSVWDHFCHCVKNRTAVGVAVGDHYGVTMQAAYDPHDDSTGYMRTMVFTSKRPSRTHLYRLKGLKSTLVHERQ